MRLGCKVVAQYGGHDPAVDLVRPTRHAFDEGLGRQVVQKAGHPVARRMETQDRLLLEQAPLHTRDGEAVSQVRSGVFQAQRNEMKRHADPLRQRPVRPMAEASAKLGLPHEHDRDEVLVVELEVGEQSDFLERGLARYEVSLIHDEKRGAVRLVEGE